MQTEFPSTPLKLVVKRDCALKPLEQGKMGGVECLLFLVSAFVFINPDGTIHWLFLSNLNWLHCYAGLLMQQLGSPPAPQMRGK